MAASLQLLDASLWLALWTVGSGLVSAQVIRPGRPMSRSAPPTEWLEGEAPWGPSPVDCPLVYTKEHSCETKCGTWSRLRCHLCQCDPDCVIFDDCCIDRELRCASWDGQSEQKEEEEEREEMEEEGMEEEEEKEDEDGEMEEEEMEEEEMEDEGTEEQEEEEEEEEVVVEEEVEMEEEEFPSVTDGRADDSGNHTAVPGTTRASDGAAFGPDTAPESPPWPPSPPSPLSLLEATRCVQTIDFDPDGVLPRAGHRLVADCPRDLAGTGTTAAEAEIRRDCQQATDRLKGGWLGLLSVPVYGGDQRHYRNVYCALCHGLRAERLVFWSIKLREKYTGSLKSLSGRGLLEAATDKRSFAELNFTREFDRPTVADGQLPLDHHMPYPRRCVLVDSTPCVRGDALTRRQCQRHNAAVAFNGTTYRNLACLRCASGRPDFPLVEWCTALRQVSSYKGRVSMAKLLIFADRTEVIGANRVSSLFGGVASACRSHELFDPFQGRCRAMACVDGAAMAANGRCRPGRSAAASETAVVGLAVGGTYRDEFVSWVAKNATGADLTWWPRVARSVAQYYASSVAVARADAGPENITWECSLDGGIVGWPLGTACGTGARFECTVNFTLAQAGAGGGVNPLLGGHAANDNSDVCVYRGSWSYVLHLLHLSLVGPCAADAGALEPNGTATGAPGRDPMDLEQAASASALTYVWDQDAGGYVVARNDTCRASPQGAGCTLLTFAREEYRWTGALNDSVLLLGYDRVLSPGEFRLTEAGGLEVCDFVAGGGEAGPGEGDDHFVLTVTGSSLSLVGVVVTMVTYVTFAPLRRNAAGKALMNLLASLFMAQLSMLIGLQRTDVTAVCVAFGISSHFFWLSAFFWMNTLAIDIYRTFGIGTKINDPNTRSVLCYALYGFGAPALIVCACAVLSLLGGAQLGVRYASEDACWIGGGMANLVAFGVPVMAVLCFNAVLFLLTVAGVMRTRRASSRMNITQGQGNAALNRTRADLALYIKLNTIMGFTWIFGFVASFSGVQFFWYPFIVLNSLQGALVCLAFVCNQRVIAMWRARLGALFGPRPTGSGAGQTPPRPMRSFPTSTSELSPASNATKLARL